MKSPTQLLGLLIVALPLAAYGEIKTLKTANEAIYFSKSTEVAIMGCFESQKGPEWTVFQQVVKELDKTGGIALGHTTDKAVWSRYLDGADGSPSAPPAVVVWSSFSPETGEVQKGRKARVAYGGPFTYTALYAFLLRESQPLVLRLPHNLGPDHAKRTTLAFRSGLPKLFVFAPAAAGGPGPGVLSAATTARAEALVVYYSVGGDDPEQDEGASVMKDLGLGSLPAGGAAVAAAVHPESGEQTKLEWDGVHGAALVEALRAFLEDKPAYEPEAGKRGVGKAPRKPSGKSGEL